MLFRCANSIVEDKTKINFKRYINSLVQRFIDVPSAKYNLVF